LPATFALVKVVKLQALVFYAELVVDILGAYSTIFFLILLVVIEFGVVADMLYFYQLLPFIYMHRVMTGALTDGA